MRSWRTSRPPTTTPSNLPPGSSPTRYTWWADFHVSRFRSLTPPNIGGHQGLDRDHLAYCNLATERQQRAYRLVHEVHDVAASQLARRNSPILDGLRPFPPCAIGGWAWVYNSADTIRQGAKKGTHVTMLKTKALPLAGSSLNWIGPFNILAVGPAPVSDVPDNRLLDDKPLCLDLPSDPTGTGLPNDAFPSSAVSPAGVQMALPTCPNTYSPTSPSTCSTPFSPSPPPSASPQTTSHHHWNASSSNRSRATNSLAAVAGILRSCMRPIETHWVGLL